MRKCVLIGVFLISYVITHKIQAQYSEIFFGIGTTTYWGDLNSEQFLRNYYYNSGVALQAGARYVWNRRFGVKASITNGSINGDDGRASDESKKLRNLSFRSNLFELGVQGEYYFLKFDTRPGAFFMAPYLTIGASGFFFDPIAIYEGRKVKLQPLGTEGQGLAGRPKEYNLFNGTLIFGGGIKFILTQQVNIGIEVGIRRTFTDYLDDVSGVYINFDEHREAVGNGPKRLAPFLGNRTGEYLGTENVSVATGTQRGGARVKDYYIITMCTANILFSDDSGKRRLGKSKSIECPKF